MVNPGHRSRGCLTCRQMKVKCDEQRPQCGRCVRTRRECPGYVRQEQPKFRSMNSSAEAKVQSRVREALAKAAGEPPAPSAKPDSKGTHSQSDSDSDAARELAAERRAPSQIPTRARRKTPVRTLQLPSSSTLRASSNPPPSHSVAQAPATTSVTSAPLPSAATREMALVPAQAPRFSRMSNDWSAQALALFFRDFTEQPDHLGSTFGTYGYLPHLYGQGQERHLMEAVNAAALANLANVSGVNAFNKMARRHYGTALIELGKAISQPESAIADETLATTSALTMYELITGEQPLNELFNSHFRGQSAILRMRGPQLVLTPWSKSLVGTTNRMLIWSDLAEGQKPSLSLPDWPVELYASEIAETSARLSSRASFVCGRVREVMEVPEVERGASWLKELTEVLNHARLLDGSLEQYMSNLPAPWKPWSLSMRFATPPPIREDMPWQKLGLGNSSQSPKAKPAPVPIPGEAGNNSSNNAANLMAFEMASVDLAPHEMVLPETFLPDFGIAGLDSVGSAQQQRPYGPARPPRTDPDGPTTYPSRIDVYPSITVAYLLVSVSCVHIHLLRSMLDLALLRDGGTAPEDCFVGFPSPKQLYRSLCGKVEDVCAAIPYVLNDVDEVGNIAEDQWHKLRHTGAATVLWGLHKVCSIPGLEPGLRQWILGVYDRVGCLGGMRKALVLADQYRLKWGTLG